MVADYGACAIPSVVTGEAVVVSPSADDPGDYAFTAINGADTDVAPNASGYTVTKTAGADWAGGRAKTGLITGPVRLTIAVPAANTGGCA
jgi:hypothetical protein